MTIDQAIKSLQAAKRAVAKEYKTCEGWDQFKKMDSKEVLKKAGNVNIMSLCSRGDSMYSRRIAHHMYIDWKVIEYYGNGGYGKYKGLQVFFEEEE